MRLISVNVGLPKTVTLMRRTVRTAFFKEPVSGAIPVSNLGLQGDGQADPKYHGGPGKAVYLYPFEHYAYWSAVLGRADLSPGAFGENFTTEGVLETETRIGDVLAIGSAKLQVTQPRTPCAKLGLRMGSMPFVRTFAAAGRPGFYLSVVEEGFVESGDAIARIATDPSRPTVAEVFG
ncbi:MAG TPA: MOSC domain-containing protein [Thermoanaerobaculia bacterium]|nr:MOSC domain-containing protein [Thermoanaerobaculia bacterium]